MWKKNKKVRGNEKYFLRCEFVLLKPQKYKLDVYINLIVPNGEF